MKDVYGHKMEVVEAETIDGRIYTCRKCRIRALVSHKYNDKFAQKQILKLNKNQYLVIGDELGGD